MAEGWDRFDTIDSEQARERLRGVVRETPLRAFPSGDERVELRVKLECLQETGAFKARGAWNQVSQLDDGQRAAGVVATSSGNHGRALAWAAQRAGIRATIFMAADSYPNKIAACRELGAEVVLTDDRQAAEAACAEAVAHGAVLIHPYDSDRTIEGAGTVGVELGEQWPELEVVVVPVGGGGLIAGASLALRRRFGSSVRVLGAEPEGAPTMAKAMAAGEPVVIDGITTSVQGLCPLSAGARNTEIARTTVDGVITLDDPTIYAAQGALVRDGRLVVEPAGAAAVAAVHSGRLPSAWLADRSAANPLRVVAVVSGGNPDPAQLAAIRREGGAVGA